MTTVRYCDYCGQIINDGSDAVRLEYHYLSIGRSRWLGDYHDLCWDKVEEVLRLAESFVGSLEHIPVATPQGIAARRRHHRRGERDV